MFLRYLTGLLFLLVSFLSGLYCGERRATPISRVDTVRIETPREVERIVYRDRVKVEKVRDTLIMTERDTIRITDTIRISLPEVSRVYTDTLHYRLQLTGVQVGNNLPRIDWIETYNKTDVITHKPRFAVVAGVGAGINPKAEITPIVGVSCGFILWAH